MRIAVVDDENYICSLLEEYILDCVDRKDNKTDIFPACAEKRLCKGKSR